jgi:hypothetical protein
VSVILDFSSEDEGGDWEEEGEGWLSSLIPLRADISSGDNRALYLAWLLCAQCEELDEDAPEPPCPPGLRKLSGPLRAFADFLRIDQDLIEVASAASAPLTELSLGEDFEQWVAALPDAERTALLVQLGREGAPVQGQLLRRFRAAVEQTSPSANSLKPRTAAELLSLAERHSEARRRKEAERQAREQARREREAAAAREKYLDGLAQREPEVWAKVNALIATKRPGDYDQAVQLLKDLRDLGERLRRSAETQMRIRQLHDEHVKKPGFLRRLAQSGLVLPG